MALVYPLLLQAMKTSKKTIVAALAIAAVLLAQCSPKTAKTVEKSSTKTETVAKNYSQADLDEGRKVFESSCGRCHALKQPETRTVSQWEKIMPNMARKAKLDDHQTAVVTAYVMKGAKS